MLAEAIPLIRFLDGADRNFLIPVYQRNYDWTAVGQCSVLWNDLCNISMCENQMHFFGSIVSIRDNMATGDAYIIIDGQQRITTVSILLIAIYQKVTEYLQNAMIVSSTDIVLPDITEIQELYIGKYNNVEKLKLKLVKSDHAAFKAILNKEESYPESNITKNWKYFRNLLKPENINDIYNAIKRLEIVDIRLVDNRDDPQLVFESLNSKGLPLNDSDKIRNLILIGLDYSTQERFYDKYWNPIEKNSGNDSNDTSKFIRYFIAYATGKLPKKSNVYQQFKLYKNKFRDSEELLQKLCNFSYVYHNIMEQSFKDDDINEKLQNLIIKLKSESATPLLLDVFDKYMQNSMPKQDVLEILDVICAYFIRRAVCNLGTAGTDTTFLINNDINDLIERRDATYADAVKYLLTGIRDTLRYPNDNEFYDALLNNDIYSLHISHCKYLLESIENYHQKEKVDTKNLTVEHIMPQTLTNEWRFDLGENAVRIHETNLHTLGNLTLTGYNSPYSNKSFNTKKKMEKGFNDSPLRINKMVREATEWNEKTIIARGKELREIAMKIWPFYKSERDYDIKSGRSEITLNSNVLLTNMKPTEFSYQNKTVAVNTWRDLYKEVINLLYDQHAYQMQVAFDHGNRDNFRDIISDRDETPTPDVPPFWSQIIPGNPVYFRVNKSAENLRAALLVWFKYLGLDADDLVIKLHS